MKFHTEIVIGAQSPYTKVFEEWSIKGGQYTEEWKKKMVKEGFELHEMHVDRMITICQNRGVDL